MAYTRNAAPRTYYGYSDDPKPKLGRQADGTTVTASELPVGSLAVELDTGVEFTFDGREWIILPRPPRDDVTKKLDELITAMNTLAELGRQILLTMH